MNNQYQGPTAWEDYLSALEAATPTIQAIAVTDYYILDAYQEIVNRKAAGRLPDAKLVFPNVELRLDVATSKGGFVNLHFFVSPEDPDHVSELQRLLTRLQFNVLQDRFDCTRADLIRLGKKADPSIADDKAALAYGANQFKVNFGQLKEIFGESAWAKQNILIAVAGSASGGTSGVRGAADQTIRREIEGFAHVIFASSPAQRAFWLGQNDLNADEIRSRYRGLKPCLHGSGRSKAARTDQGGARGRPYSQAHRIRSSGISGFSEVYLNAGVTQARRNSPGDQAVKVGANEIFHRKCRDISVA